MRRCSAACTDGDITSSTVSRTSACTNWYVSRSSATLTRNPLSTSSSSPAADLVGGHPGGLRQHPGFDALTGDRGELQGTAGPPRQPRHPAADDLLDRIGSADAADVAAHHPAVVVAHHHPVVDQVAPQLAEEERVPAAAFPGSSGEHPQLACRGPGRGRRRRTARCSPCRGHRRGPG